MCHEERGFLFRIPDRAVAKKLFGVLGNPGRILFHRDKAASADLEGQMTLLQEIQNQLIGGGAGGDLKADSIEEIPFGDIGFTA